MGLAGCRGVEAGGQRTVAVWLDVQLGGVGRRADEVGVVESDVPARIIGRVDVRGAAEARAAAPRGHVGSKKQPIPCTHLRESPVEDEHSEAREHHGGGDDERHVPRLRAAAPARAELRDY